MSAPVQQVELIGGPSDGLTVHVPTISNTLHMATPCCLPEGWTAEGWKEKRPLHAIYERETGNMEKFLYAGVGV